MVKDASVNEKPGTIFFQDQGKLSEICYLSVKFGILTMTIDNDNDNDNDNFLFCTLEFTK